MVVVVQDTLAALVVLLTVVPEVLLVAVVVARVHLALVAARKELPLYPHIPVVLVVVEELMERVHHLVVLVGAQGGMQLETL